MNRIIASHSNSNNFKPFVFITISVIENMRNSLFICMTYYFPISHFISLSERYVFSVKQGRQPFLDTLCGTVPRWKVLFRNTQALKMGRIFPAFQRYFKLLTNNQNNYSKEKSIFEYFLELVVSHIRRVSAIKF